MKVIFFYDYICPFCYIGSKRIVNLAEELNLEIEWKGIEIHPEYTTEGKKRKRTPRLNHITQTLFDIAKEDNTEIKLPGFVTNSRLCLEAAEFAKTKNKFLDFHNNAYDAYFNKRENIGLLENVIKIGGMAGLDTGELESSLKNREMREIINQNKKYADEKTVLGVPTVYFNDFRVHGVQSPQSYRNIIKKHILN